ncbi:MAG: hypothetical protein IJ009_00325 [Clostridia bacterium]|nr:hypothetical protein [Clostridia bacterium]
MKRAAVFLSLALLLSSLLCLPVGAVDTEEYFSDFFDTLPDEVRDTLSDADEYEEAAELVGVERLFALFLTALQNGIDSAIPSLLRLLGIAILLALLSHLAADLPESSAAAAQGGIGVILTFLLFRFAEADFARATACLTDLSEFTNGLIPVFFGLFAAGGGTATATASAAGFTGFSYLIKSVCVALLLPLLRLLFAFTAIRTAGGKLKTESLFSSLRTAYVTTLAFLSLLLVTSLGFQSSLAASADSLAAGAVRFTVGQLVPVVGSSLAGSLRTVAASLSLVKGTLGTLSVFALLSMLLPPLVELLLHRLCLSLCASVSGMLGNERAREAFSAFRGIYDLAAATLAVCLVLFILVIALLLRCGIAIAPA